MLIVVVSLRETRFVLSHSIGGTAPDSARVCNSGIDGPFAHPARPAAQRANVTHARTPQTASRRSEMPTLTDCSRLSVLIDSMIMWIKICGIRDVVTAQAVAQAGADAIGLNFYANSPRVVSPETAARIVAALPPGTEPVGVFVDHSEDEVRAIARQCGLKTIQLHGDEPPEITAALSRDFRVVRAFRVGDEGLTQIGEYLLECDRRGASVWACLLDANVPGSFGGTGHVAPWETIGRQYDRQEWPPLILAGGLRPDNVAQAVAAVDPWGVDVAGGVESSVACKDIALVRQFVLNANLQSN